MVLFALCMCGVSGNFPSAGCVHLVPARRGDGSLPAPPCRALLPALLRLRVTMVFLILLPYRARCRALPFPGRLLSR